MSNLKNVSGYTATYLADAVGAFAIRLTMNGDTPYTSGFWDNSSFQVGNSEENKKSISALTLKHDKREWNIVNTENYSDVRVSTKCFSLIVFSIALSNVSLAIYEQLESIKGFSFENPGECKDVVKAMELITEMYKEIQSHVHEILNEDELEAFCKVTD